MGLARVFSRLCRLSDVAFCNFYYLISLLKLVTYLFAGLSNNLIIDGFGETRRSNNNNNNAAAFSGGRYG